MKSHWIDLFCSMDGLSVLNRDSYHRMLWRRRMMALSTVTTCIGVVLLSVCAASSNWALVELSLPDNTTIQLKVGIWGEHKVILNGSHSTNIWIPYFPGPPPEIHRLKNMELQHFHRAMAVFTAIALSLMVASNGFALYSFFHHRYTYKRLTAGLMALVAMCVLVVIETLSHSVSNWRAISEAHLTTYVEDYSRGLRYGPATWLAWTTVAIYTIAALCFTIGSQKQKGQQAATQEFEVEDRPFNLGR
ncbi:hypothetical protein M514_01447 [Trichuris suis]|uniref:Uncharacterized protein n=1 Tax=Trichuris suis TaxID=68888 RepID=A0A085MKN1_9BILA|nr:hypothetical protein M513_01447 [Trichuris suis]KFD65499.1 hypothetical protein M514_01447 [Trichuris suis]